MYFSFAISKWYEYNQNNIHAKTIPQKMTCKEDTWQLFLQNPGESFDPTYHKRRILHTHSVCSPLWAENVLIYTSLSWPLLLWLVKRPHMNPLCCRPLLAFDHRTASMQTVRICCCIRAKANEEQSITFFGFHSRGKTLLDCPWSIPTIKVPDVNRS